MKRKEDWRASVDWAPVVRRMPSEQRDAFPHHFAFHAHAGQQPPEGDWRTWLIMAGRGFGKTRAGAEWVRAVADADPHARIALVGATLGDARAVMVEGESGLLACCPKPPLYEPSLRRVSFANGARAFLYGANEPEALRGPQHSHASKARPPPRRFRPKRANAGSSGRARPGRGTARTASWRASKRATGCSSTRATASAFATARRAR